MKIFYFTMALTVFSNLLYHISQKSIPNNINPMFSIIVTYITAIVLSIIIFPFYPAETNIGYSFKKLNWASFAVGVSIVGVEIGFLLAYRAGWNISLGAVVSNVAVTLLLIPAGILLFKERLSIANVTGIIFCIIGLILVSKK